MDIALFWSVFGFSFLVALTGALVPGPLLTYTIVKTLRTNRRGFLVGAWVITGHALLESAIIIGLLLGLASLLRSSVIVKTIGVVGGGFLLYMGVSLIMDVVRKRVPDVFETKDGAAAVAATEGVASSTHAGGGIHNPVLGGLLVSMSNPYFWIWWATVGFAFMIRFDVSFANWPVLLIFFLGHEAGDLAWYVATSTLVDIGKRKITLKVYNIILTVCAVVIIGFGGYLGVSIFLGA
jgi:threonine/homoserine/homoserine lactone efflux protein